MTKLTAVACEYHIYTQSDNEIKEKSNSLAKQAKEFGEIA